MKSLILTTILVTQTVMAAEVGPVVHLDVNQPAPYSGYLFTEAKELEVRQNMEELKTDKIILENNTKLLTLKDAQVVLLTDQAKLWQDQSTALAKQVVEKENSGFWKFVSGCALTTVLAFAVSRAIK